MHRLFCNYIIKIQYSFSNMYKYILFIALLPIINTILCTVYYILLIYYRKKTTVVSRIDNPYVYIPYVGIFEYICITYYYKPRVVGY